MAEKKNATDGAGPPAKPAQGMNPLLVLERTAGIQLSNRFIWLVVAVGLYLILQLSYIQWQTGTKLGNPRFDTLELVSILLAVCEFTLLAVAVLITVGTSRTRQAWYRKYPRERFSWIAAGFGGILALIMVQAVLLVPILVLHRYPELIEAGIRIPLLVLQRVVLLNCVLIFSYNLILVLRHVLRLPWALAGIGGVACQVGTGYLVTALSAHNEGLARLNDLFIYNQLWHYFDRFPKLTSVALYHNIQMPYLAYYLGFGSIAALVSLVFWLPRASTLSTREKPPETTG